MKYYEQLLCNHGCRSTLRINYLDIPTYEIPTNIDGAHEFNIIYGELLQDGLSPLLRTPSGGIKARQVFPAMDVQITNMEVELTIIAAFHCLRIVFSTIFLWDAYKDHSLLGGEKSYKIFHAYFKNNYHIDLETYKIPNGAEIKATIPRYKIAMEDDNLINQVITNAHHIDFHSSFAGGWANTFPEFGEGLRALYNQRLVVSKEESKRIKSMCCSIIGYFQSIPRCKASWAHISKAAIADNNRRIEELSSKLSASGRTVIAYNTDGIWYSGEIYHGAGEGKGLGEWENDHINCTVRFKSAGSYEYIENDNYFPVVRGLTRLDKLKPRCDWAWGDIYQSNAEPLTFIFMEGIGVVDSTNTLY